MKYIATFHTHLAALMTSRSLTRLGLGVRMAPVPRKLSSSCGLFDAVHGSDFVVQ